jgi:short subunit dehydrogenase-like uncharacterized protein
MKENRKYDITLFGASGYTGRLIAEYLWNKYAKHQSLKLAIAGRSLDKLQGVKADLGASEELGILFGDAEDLGSLTTIANSTRLIITTVGPYQLYGANLVEACASTGTDYLDLCVETHWIRRMIDTYTAPAKASGARILFSCGFDSIPSEIGVYSVQEAAKYKTGSYASSVKCFVRELKGGFSGGTAESINATLSSAAHNEGVAKLLADPFALTPGFSGPPQPETNAVTFDDDLGVWTAPWMMTFINTRNVHRLNYLLDQRFGERFVYDERVMTGPGAEGRASADAVASAPSPLIGDHVPKPGCGPTKEERDSGSFDLLFSAQTEKAGLLKVGVRGDKDPGYGSTSKMISETAMVLLTPSLSCPGGIWTPGAALRDQLKERLSAQAGILVSIED